MLVFNTDFFRLNAEEPFMRFFSEGNPMPSSLTSKTVWHLQRGLLLGLMCLFVMLRVDAATLLTLPAAEQIVVQQNPSLAVFQKKIEALRHQAVAAAQLPDPHLSLGAEDLPTNNFSLNQQQMSMLGVGLSQTFPPFGQLALRRRQLQQEANAEAASRAERVAELVWFLRQSWIQAITIQKELDIVGHQRRLAAITEQAAMAAYRAGRVGQADVLRSQLAREDLVNDIDQLQAQRRSETARIAQLLNLSSLPELVDDWPDLPKPPSLTALQSQLVGHPALQAAAAQDRAADLGVRAARRDYLPSITVSASYGRDFVPGSPNWLSVGINLSLPIFPADRQDQTVAAARAKSFAARDEYDELHLALERQARSAFAHYQAAQAEYQRSHQVLLPTARRVFRTALVEFTTGRARMEEVLQAQNAVLDLALKTLKFRRDRALRIAELDFLATQNQGAPRT